MTRIKVIELDITISPQANRLLTLILQSATKKSQEYRTYYQVAAIRMTSDYLKYLYELHDKRVIFMHEYRPYVTINPMIIPNSSYQMREHWNELYE